MSCWTHIILEAYCTRKWSAKKGKYIYKPTDSKKFELEKAPNANYDPNYKTPKKPWYCPGVPLYKCLEKECSYLGYANALEEDYLFLNKKYKKK